MRLPLTRLLALILAAQVVIGVASAQESPIPLVGVDANTSPLSATLNAIIRQVNGLFTTQMNTSASNAVVGTAQANLAVSPSVSSGINAGSIAIANAGSGYAVGDTITLTCSGCTITTNPIAVVAAVTGGAVTTIQVNPPNNGVITGASGSSLTFTQSSTTGVGTGFTMTGTLGTFASGLSLASLLTGGGGGAGSLYITAEGPLSTLYGAENTFLGDRAGSHFDASSGANTCVGHNACGNQGAGTVTANNNVALGDDAMRNMTGTPASNSCLGTNTCRVIASNNNVAVGSGAGVAATTGGNVTLVGTNAGNKIVGGAGNLILGTNTASTTLTGGGNNILISSGQNGADVDTPAINSGNMLQISRSIAGTIANHANNNNPSICAVGMHCVLGVLRTADFNSVADQSIVITPLTSTNVGFIAGATKYIVTDIYVANCSASLTTAQGGFYTAASKGGTIIGAVTTAFTNCTSATTMQRLSALTNEDTTVFTAATLRLSLTTAQGSAATGDVYVIGIPIN